MASFVESSAWVGAKHETFKTFLNMLGLLNSWVLEFKIYFKFLPQSTTSKYFFNILTSADAKPRNKKKIPSLMIDKSSEKYFS